MRVKPPPFDYVRAGDVEHALALLREHGDEASPVSGGQSLIPLLNLRMARPAVLVDVNDLPLAQINTDDGTVTTGALVRHRMLCAEPTVRLANPLLSEAARFIGHAAIRNRGTVGGSIAHADPSAELSLVALACDAQVLLRSVDGTRTVAAADYFQGPFMTCREPEELVEGVRWAAVAAPSSWGFAEIAERSGDFATAAAAVVIRGGDDPVARVAVSGVPGSPARLPDVEAMLAAPGAGGAEFRECARAAVTARVTDGDSRSDRHIRSLVEEMVVRAGTQALERSRGAA